MSKNKKILFSSMMAIAILIFFSTWLAGRLLAATISKEFVTQKLGALTGYSVVIDGPLHWHSIMRPGLRIEKITFSDARSATIVLQKVNITINLLPLLKKQVALDFDFQQWQQNQLHFSKGTTHLDFRKGLLTLSRFKAKFYQGGITGNAKINLNATPPTFKIILDASQVEMADLLNDIANTATLSGKMSMQAALNSQGKDAKTFISHLSGNISLLVNQGKLNTIHLSTAIPSMTPSEKNTADVFETLTIKSILTQGVAKTTIQLNAKNYRAEGTGKININKQTLNLVLNASYLRSQKTKNIALPIHISGQIAAPRVNVDLAKPLAQLFNANSEKIAHKLQQLFR